MKRVCFITTLRHNIGDDFVREGILHLLGRVVGEMQVSCVHKHLPLTARPLGRVLRSTGLDRGLAAVERELPRRLFGRIDEILPLSARTDSVLGCDVLVQSGAPVYWSHAGNECQENEWWGPLLERRWIPSSAGKVLLNLAAGTCQTWGSDGSEFVGRRDMLDYVRRFHDLAALTTVRDRLGMHVLSLAGRSAELVPCTSLFAVDRLAIASERGDHVVLNYRRPTVRDTFGVRVDADAWERRFVTFATRLASTTPCVMVCHDRGELAAARRLLPGVRRFHSPHHADYLRVYARARWGIVNRVHAGFALASLGKPAAIVGVDSRAQMGPLVGLESVYVDAADERWLADTARRLAADDGQFAATIAALKRDAAARYEILLRGAIENGSR